MCDIHIDVSYIYVKRRRLTFEQADIPFLFFTSGRDRRYHTPEDTAEHLDYSKMASLSDLLAEALIRFSNELTVTYLPDAHDDVATLASISEVARLAVPRDGRTDRLFTLLAGLQARAEGGEPLSGLDRGTVQTIVLSLEEALA